MSLNEMSVASGINKSTLFGLVNTLTKLGYMYQNEDNKKYSLGLKLFTLSNLINKYGLITRSVHRYLEIITQKYGETAHCAAESNGTVIYLDKVSQSNSLFVHTEIGSKNYMHCTGVGKCLLAYMSISKQDQILANGLKQLTYNTITNEAMLKREFEQIYRQGYATDNEELEIGLSCIAVPVFRYYNNVALSISIAGATPKIESLDRTEIVNYLRGVAEEISYELYAYQGQSK
jgi:DNA-binding IclR family transcriptional regulator